MSEFDKFKEKVRVEKCDGEITEDKLIVFIRNFNKLGRMTKVIIDPDKILVVSLFGEMQFKHTTDGLVSCLMHIMSGGGV